MCVSKGEMSFCVYSEELETCIYRYEKHGLWLFAFLCSNFSGAAYVYFDVYRASLTILWDW